VVGGVGQRGVVATASYEARVFGVRSAMPAHEARRRCPHAAFLSGRFDAYREASGQVMRVLRELSPLVEPLSLDEAFVDLLAAPQAVDFSPAGLAALVAELKQRVAEATGGLTASVGIGSSKFIAKVATELRKPDGLFVVEPGSEVELLRPMSVRVLPGVGPVTLDKLHRIGIDTVADLQQVTLTELVQVVGRAHGQGLVELAFARDDRGVEPEREAKSISVEDTFETDVADVSRLQTILERDARQVASRLRTARLFARTVMIKVRMHDFVTQTRSRSLLSATDRPELITQIARTLLAGVDVSAGVRLLGVGVAGLTDVLQEDLFSHGDSGPTQEVERAGEMAEAGDVEGTGSAAALASGPGLDPQGHRWTPGQDVVHDEHGAGWVWGSGLGRVTVRFETADTGPGPVRTFRADDDALRSGRTGRHTDRTADVGATQRP
jgi:DNA polymerase-4